MFVSIAIVPELLIPVLNAELIWPLFIRLPIDPELVIPVPPPPMLPPLALVREEIVAPRLFIKPELRPEKTPAII